MGIEKIIGSVAAPLVGGLLGGKKTSAQPTTQNVQQSGTHSGTQSSTSTNSLDPRIAQLLGLNGGGVLGNLDGLLKNGGSSLAGQSNSFLNSNAGQILNNGMAGTNTLMSGQYNAPAMQAAQVAAPAQNNINLTDSYNSLINGTPGSNPHLTGAIQKGINQSSNAFGNMVTDAKAATQDVLGGIRGNSVLAGQFGGSRQGLAEGKAIDSMNTNLARAATQFGQHNTDAAVAAQAGAYDADRNRQLAATQGLGAQQYGVASQDAAARQAADQTNIQALLATRGQNSSNLATGIGLQQGLLGSAANYSNADLSRLGQIGGILQPFLGAGATVSNNGTSSGTSNSTSNTVGTQPVYQNQGAGALSGALAGAQLGGLFGDGSTDYNSIRNGTNIGSNLSNFFGLGGPSSTSLQTQGSAGNYHYAPQQQPVQQFGYGW